MDYNVYAQNVGVAITDKIALRGQANQRHKQYTGKLYEEVDYSLQKKMEEFASQGSSYETPKRPQKDDPKKIRLRRSQNLIFERSRTFPIVVTIFKKKVFDNEL